MFAYVSPQVCRSVASDYILLPSLQARTAEIGNRTTIQQRSLSRLSFCYFFGVIFTWLLERVDLLVQWSSPVTKLYQFKFIIFEYTHRKENDVCWYP